MSAVRNSLWIFVVLAALAVAAAVLRTLIAPAASPSHLGELGDAVPENLRGKVWIGRAGDGYCDRCAPLYDALTSAGKKLEAESCVNVVLIDHSSEPPVDIINRPPVGPPVPNYVFVGEGEGATLADRIFALAGAPAVASSEILLKSYGNLGTWSLTDQDGKPFGHGDLRGKIWIACFIFTRCAGPCPDMCKGMQELVKKLPDDPRLRFVSFSCDPEYDKPPVLLEFAKYWEAPPRWTFASGMGVWNIAYDGFKLVTRPAETPTPGGQFIHSTRFTLVDGDGRMRGLYTYDYENRESIAPTLDAIARDARALLETPGRVVDHTHDRRFFLVDRDGKLRGARPVEEIDALVRDARRLARSPEKLLSVRTLPRLNAVLNGASFVFLSVGFGFILNKKIGPHKACMVAAFFTSLLFLASYITYHVQAGSVRYAGEGWMRSAYFAVLISHTALAVLVAPLAIITMRLAWHERFDRHRSIARWTLPIWMYVSLTGILVYLMLYQIS